MTLVVYVYVHVLYVCVFVVYVCVYISTFSQLYVCMPCVYVCYYLVYVCVIAAVHCEVNRVLDGCKNGMTAVLEHEESLFRRGILSEDNLSLLILEQTLLQLAGTIDVTQGVFYYLAVPNKNGSHTVRFVFLLCFSNLDTSS